MYNENTLLTGLFFQLVTYRNKKAVPHQSDQLFSNSDILVLFIRIRYSLFD